MTPFLSGLLLSFVVTLSYVGLLKVLANKQVLDSTVLRKLLHIGIGPVYMLAWNFYGRAQLQPNCCYVASVVPASITVAFAAVGLGLMKDRDLVNTMSRSGSSKELLRGPLIYGIMHVVLTCVFWESHPAGVIALSVLCGGDGTAELVGKKWGRKTGVIPWSKSKTWAGSLSFVVCSAVMSYYVLVFVPVAHWSGSANDLKKLLLVALGSSVVESLPLKEIDNATVTLTAAALSYIFF